jgi:hypothetical protein
MLFALHSSLDFNIKGKGKTRLCFFFWQKNNVLSALQVFSRVQQGKHANLYKKIVDHIKTYNMLLHPGDLECGCVKHKEQKRQVELG